MRALLTPGIRRRCLLGSSGGGSSGNSGGRCDSSAHQGLARAGQSTVVPTAAAAPGPVPAASSAAAASAALVRLISSCSVAARAAAADVPGLKTSGCDALFGSAGNGNGGEGLRARQLGALVGGTSGGWVQPAAAAEKENGGGVAGMEQRSRRGAADCSNGSNSTLLQPDHRVIIFSVPSQLFRPTDWRDDGSRPAQQQLPHSVRHRRQSHHGHHHRHHYDDHHHHHHNERLSHNHCMLLHEQQQQQQQHCHYQQFVLAASDMQQHLLAPQAPAFGTAAATAPAAPRRQAYFSTAAQPESSSPTAAATPAAAKPSPPPPGPVGSTASASASAAAAPAAAADAEGAAAGGAAVAERMLRTENSAVEAAKKLLAVLPLPRNPLHAAGEAVALRKEAAALQLQAFWQANAALLTGATALAAVVVLDKAMASTLSLFLSDSLSLWSHVKLLAASSGVVAGGGWYVHSRTAVSVDAVRALALSRLNADPGVLEVLGAPVTTAGGTAPVAAALYGGGVLLAPPVPAPPTPAEPASVASLNLEQNSSQQQQQQQQEASEQGPAAEAKAGSAKQSVQWLQQQLQRLVQLPARHCACVFVARGADRWATVAVVAHKAAGKYALRLLSVDVHCPPALDDGEALQKQRQQQQRLFLAGSEADYSEAEETLLPLVTAAEAVGKQQQQQQLRPWVGRGR